MFVFSLLYYRKDIDKFFAHPVTDLIAPGYSTIIANPMDFSTMKKKIKDGKYITIEEYQVNDISIEWIFK